LVWLFFLPITYAIPLYWLEKTYFNNCYEESKAELIVILGAGLTSSSTMQQPNLNLMLLERVRFGAFLQRETSLPILVTGAGSHSKVTEAELMKKVLEEEFCASVKYVEDRSNSTLENAKFTAEILREHNIKTIFLVSNSWHLKRASFIFEKYAREVNVIPIADFAYASKSFNFDKSDFVPSLATPYYQRRFYLELFRLAWQKLTL